ncbi:unnamed protein product [Dimorphilus gyrociliatus]|uniref:Uncharacterized protein n=1 Tax=Dimorphilus gyrociliatus TaxID=2664684 RepID=A0A7I8V7W9_9ANNE|nr:unnamed protein product [Dimorphilus gyrociliatus]
MSEKSSLRLPLIPAVHTTSVDDEDLNNRISPTSADSGHLWSRRGTRLMPPKSLGPLHSKLIDEQRSKSSDESTGSHFRRRLVLKSIRRTWPSSGTAESKCKSR